MINGLWFKAGHNDSRAKITSIGIKLTRVHRQDKSKIVSYFAILPDGDDVGGTLSSVLGRIRHRELVEFVRRYLDNLRGIIRRALDNDLSLQVISVSSDFNVLLGWTLKVSGLSNDVELDFDSLEDFSAAVRDNFRGSASPPTTQGP